MHKQPKIPRKPRFNFAKTHAGIRDKMTHQSEFLMFWYNFVTSWRSRRLKIWGFYSSMYQDYNLKISARSEYAKLIFGIKTLSKLRLFGPPTAYFRHFIGKIRWNLPRNTQKFFLMIKNMRFILEIYVGRIFSTKNRLNVGVSYNRSSYKLCFLYPHITVLQVSFTGS